MCDESSANVSPAKKKRKREVSEKESEQNDESNDVQLNEENEIYEQFDENMDEDEDEEVNQEIDQDVNQCEKSKKIQPPHLTDQFSCIEHVHKQIKFPILPIAMNQEFKVIRQTLIHKWKYRFSNELNGFLYYFDNLELIESNGQIMDDLPFIYYHISADFYVFRPKIGDYLKAKISCFDDSNRMINCSSDFELTISIQLPEEITEKLHKYLKLHQEIIFLIESLNYSKMAIEGTINKQCLKLMEKHVEIVNTNLEQRQNDQNESNLDDFFAS